MQNSVRDGDNKILLPKKLWCSIRQSKEGETLSEVGWLLDHGQAITSSCLFSSTAKLKASYKSQYIDFSFLSIIDIEMEGPQGSKFPLTFRKQKYKIQYLNSN